MPSASTSPGLNFLQAASIAMPSTLSDRVIIAALNEALRFAIHCKMHFAEAEMPAMLRLRRQTSAGVFRPDDERFYSLACAAGSTFAGAWEKHFGLKPWIAPKVLVDRDPDVMINNRVAPGLAVLIDSDAEIELATFQGKQIWWCTSFDASEIALCRYHCDPNDTPLVARGRPARRMFINRTNWAGLFGAATTAAA